MKKQIVWLLLACLLAASVFGGCQKTDTPDTSAPDASAAESADSGDVDADSTAEPDGDSAEEPSADDSAGATTANGGSETRSTTKKVSSTTKKPSSETVKLIKDLKGYKFVIAQSRYGDPPEYTPGESELADARHRRDEYIQKAYNCKIVYQYYEPTTFFNSAKAVIMGGDKFADLMTIELFVFSRLYVQDMLYDISTLPHVALNSDAYYKTHTDMMTFKNGTFGTNMGINNGAKSGAMVHYNRKIIKECKVEDPQDLVKKGEWTWDKFKSLIAATAKDLDGNGSFTEKDRFGVTSASYSGLVPNFFSAGIPALKKDKNGKITYNLGTSEAQTALLKFDQMFSAKGGFYTADFEKQVKQYTEGKATFFLGTLGSMAVDAGIEDAVVPFPVYKKGMSYIAGQSHDTNMVAVPKTIKDPETTGLLMQALAERSKSEWDLYCEDYKANFLDDTSAQMFEKYIWGKGNADLMTLVLQLDMTLYNGTQCAIGNPVLSDQLASDLVYSNAEACQILLDDMFNAKKAK